MSFILKGDNGTYFVGWTGIGPCFGGTRDTAERFETRVELAQAMMRHWAMTGEVEEVADASETGVTS